MSATHKEQLQRLMRMESFQPFRLHTKGGEVFTVLDYVTVLAAGWDVIVPAGVTPENIYGEYPVPVPYEQIERIELLGPAPVSGGKV